MKIEIPGHCKACVRKNKNNNNKEDLYFTKKVPVMYTINIDKLPTLTEQLKYIG